MAECKALNETKQAASMPAVPEPVEAVMRQVWGAAWQEAQGQLEGEREALSTARKEIAKERAEMLAEIGRMDTEMEVARDSIAKVAEDLEAERQAHERTKSDVREAHAVTERSLAALRIEAATLTERAAHIEELRVLVKTLQAQQRAAEDAGPVKKTARRRSKPEGLPAKVMRRG